MSVNEDNTSTPVEPPEAKRRKLNASATRAILSKPFRSPFRGPPKVEATHVTGSDTTNDEPSTAGQEQRNNDSDCDRIENGGPGPKRLSLSTTDSRPQDRRGLGLHKAQDLAARRSQTALIGSIASVRKDIDSLKQAIKLASGTRDTELDELADKWQAAAQLAAEEVFSSCRDQVNRMGGVGAWRERELQQKAWQNQWDEPVPQTSGAGEDAGSDEDRDEEDEAEGQMEEMGKEERRALREIREQLEGEKRDASTQDFEADGEAEVQDSDGLLQGSDDDTFTMGMMLRILKIDLAVIGYSEERQTWGG